MMLTLLKMYRTDANTFTEIYGKLKAADTLVLFVRKLAVIGLKLTLELKLG